jgi:hypothetical protein
MTMEVMTMEKVTRCPPKSPREVTGCPPKSPMGPTVTMEPVSEAESVVAGVITIVAIWGVGIVVTVRISVARANGVAVTGATTQACGYCPKH